MLRGGSGGFVWLETVASGGLVESVDDHFGDGFPIGGERDQEILGGFRELIQRDIRESCGTRLRGWRLHVRSKV